MDKIEREKQVVVWMIELYCKKHHGTLNLCKDCQYITEYAIKRLSHCKFGNDKPTCKNCTIHCYAPEQREMIRTIMRYSGPRMMLYHPWAAIQHILHN